MLTNAQNYEFYKPFSNLPINIRTMVVHVVFIFTKIKKAFRLQHNLKLVNFNKHNRGFTKIQVYALPEEFPNIYFPALNQ